MGVAAEQILVFEVAGQRFGLPLSGVKELVPMVATTPVPGSPGLEGLVDLRGEVVPVLDLRRALGFPSKPPEPSDHLIVGWVEGRLVAVRVDRVLDLAAAPEAGAAVLFPAVATWTGVAPSPEGLVLLPDLRVCLAGMEGRLAEPLPPVTPANASEDDLDLEPHHP